MESKQRRKNILLLNEMQEEKKLPGWLSRLKMFRHIGLNQQLIQFQWFSLSYAGWKSWLLDCNCISLRGNCFGSLPETQSSSIYQTFLRKLCVSSVMYSPLFSSFAVSVTKGYRWCNLTMFVKAVLHTHAESYSGKHFWNANAHGKTPGTLLLSLSFFLQFSSVRGKSIGLEVSMRLWHEITFKTLLILKESTLPRSIQLMRQITCYLQTAFLIPVQGR